MSPEDEFRVMCGDGAPLAEDADFHEVGCNCRACKERETSNALAASALKAALAERAAEPPVVVGRDWLPTPSPRPIVVVGTPGDGARVAYANNRRPVFRPRHAGDLSCLQEFDFVVYQPERATATELRKLIDIVEALQSRPGAHEISIEKAEGRPALDPERHTVDGMSRKEIVEHFGSVMEFQRLLETLPPEDRERVRQAVRARWPEPVVDRQTELELRRIEARRQHEQEERDDHLIEKYGPKTAVTRICGWKREDRHEPATVHENAHNLGTDSGNDDAYRMGFKQDLGDA